MWWRQKGEAEAEEEEEEEEEKKAYKVPMRCLSEVTRGAAM